MFDSHCHLHQIPDCDRIAEEFCRQGGKAVICTTQEEEWESALALCNRHPGQLFAALGIHPWYAGEARPGWEARLEALLLSHPQASIGECGTDALRGPGPEIQDHVLQTQFSLAIRLKRPVSLHCVRSHHLLLTALAKHQGIHGLVHRYEGGEPVAREYIAQGCSISIRVTRGKRIPSAAPGLPSESILAETDMDISSAPKIDTDLWLSLWETSVQAIAQARSMDSADCIRMVESNAERLFCQNR